MRIGHRPLIFSALLVLEEAAAASAKLPVPIAPGIRLALAYLCAISGEDRAVFDGFVEAIGREAQPWETDWQPGYLRQRDANGSIQTIVRSLGFNPTVTALHALSGALRGKDPVDQARLFWREVDLQAELGMRRPRPGCEWLTPRAWSPVDQPGVSAGVSPAAEPPENG